MLSERVRRQVLSAAAILRDAERPVRILRTIAWPPETAERFFAAGARELPVVEYTPLDPEPVLEGVQAALRLLVGGSPVHAWLRQIADRIAGGARMLAAVGTPEFFTRSSDLYGTPQSPLVDQVTTSLDLARQLEAVLDSISPTLFEDPEGEVLDASELASRIDRLVRRHLGDAAPSVEVVEHLSANALAGPRYIRIRAEASFSERDLAQLVHHEAFVHVVTSLNGQAQTAIPVLACSHPGTTRTQEGLAVFAEFITGSMDPARLRRLADRVLAIQMAIEGADFLDLYNYFVERTDTPQQAFDDSRRVLRGGVLAGGAPFTKDGVYLDGLLRVHNFLRSVVQFGRTDCLRLLFCGKLDLEDIPALCVLAHNGLCRMPKFLPPWVADVRFLVCYLAYSSFLNRIDLERIRTHYAELLARTPMVPDTMPEP